MVNVYFEEDVICTECAIERSEQQDYTIRFDHYAGRYCMRFCECKCEPEELHFCTCHEQELEDDNTTTGICGCCQVCRHMISVRLNIPELEELKKRDVILVNFDTCSQCEQYVIHHYYNKKNGITVSYGCYRKLHKSVYKLITSTCENKVETITLSQSS
jgi:hypothetical protein